MRFGALTGPCFLHAVVDKESSEFSSGGSSGPSPGSAVAQDSQQEQTQPKQRLVQDDSQGALFLFLLPVLVRGKGGSDGGIEGN